MVPAEGRPKNFEASILLAPKAPKQKCGVSLKHYKRRRDGGTGSKGREVGGVRGGTPPPHTVYGPSNTSLGVLSAPDTPLKNPLAYLGTSPADSVVWLA